MDNYYAIFNIDENLHGDELQTELRKIQKRLITRQNAADINRRQEAERKLVLIQEAMDILLDEEKRKEYDAQLIHANHKKQTDSKQHHQEADSQYNHQSQQELIDLAHDLIGQMQYPQAMNAAKQALAISNQSAEAWSVYGYACAAWREYDEAVRAYKNAITVNPAVAHNYTELANLYLQLDQINDAKEMINKAIHINPDDMFTREVEASIYMEEQQYNQAVQIYEALLKENADNEQIKTLLASCYEQIGMSYLYYDKSSRQFYCIDEGNTQQMIHYMQKAYDLTSENYLQDQISFGQKALRKKLDFTNWSSLVLAILIGLFSNSLLLTIILAGIVLYVNHVPNYKLNRRALLNEKTIGDRVGFVSSGIYKAIKYIVVAIVGFVLIIFSIFLG